MKRALVFLLGVLVGQWLTFGAVVPLGDPWRPTVRTLERRPQADAGKPWEGPSGGARLVHVAERLGSADAVADGGEVAVPLEFALGVWVVDATLNDGRPARFLVDTGSSVVIVAPDVAAAAGVTAPPSAPRIELQTVAGRSSGPAVQVRSLRVGGVELGDVTVVLHDPGAGFDGILGNAFLSRYRLTLDPDRHLLVLRPLAPGPVALPPGPHLLLRTDEPRSLAGPRAE